MLTRRLWSKAMSGRKNRMKVGFFGTKVEANLEEHEVVIGLGANMGDRLGQMLDALHLMADSGIHIKRHSRLYETSPAYFTDQPPFLNAAVRGSTLLGAHDLLWALKKIESRIGRVDGPRYGPRPIDLDILFHGLSVLHSDDLTVPHTGLLGRPFVMAPLADLLGTDTEHRTVDFWHSFATHPRGLFGAWDELGGEASVGKEGLRRVLPVKGRLWEWSEKTSVMGVLNVTSDSFSDGGQFVSPETAVSRVRSMISEGADIIDIGAQSTRPAAPVVSPEAELGRLLPVLEAVMEVEEIREGRMVVSVDTFYAEVAQEAVMRGAHMVNDVSAGRFDPGMHGAVSRLRVPYVSMHSRGGPSTMHDREKLRYDGGVCEEVAAEILEGVDEAELCGIPAWSIIVDPGIGFSKEAGQNLEILGGIEKLREEIGRGSMGMSRAPVLIGPSRKSFLGEVCERGVAAERDPATVASVTAGVLGGANMVRVHNVRDSVDAVKVCDAILKRSPKRG